MSTGEFNVFPLVHLAEGSPLDPDTTEEIEMGDVTRLDDKLDAVMEEVRGCRTDITTLSNRQADREEILHGYITAARDLGQRALDAAHAVDTDFAKQVPPINDRLARLETRVKIVFGILGTGAAIALGAAIKILLTT